MNPTWRPAGSEDHAEDLARRLGRTRNSPVRLFAEELDIVHDTAGHSDFDLAGFDLAIVGFPTVVGIELVQRLGSIELLNQQAGIGRYCMGISCYVVQLFVLCGANLNTWPPYC